MVFRNSDYCKNCNGYGRARSEYHFNGVVRSSLSQMLFKIGALKNFAIFTGKLYVHALGDYNGTRSHKHLLVSKQTLNHLAKLVK